MKPAAFEYHAPDSVEEALALLSEHGWDAKALAGGQSLVPAMNFRLARPAVLVDLNRIDELAFIRRNEDEGRDGGPGSGGVRIGAMTRQRAVERSELVAELAPLLTEMMPHIAHPQIRNRGTFGGSAVQARRVSAGSARRSSFSASSARPWSRTSSSSRSLCLAHVRGRGARFERSPAVGATTRWPDWRPS